MKTTVEAIYEHGSLRLLGPISLPEGARVQVLVLADDGSSDGGTPAEILTQIAALPLEVEGDTFSGRDHDQILYGAEQPR